VNQDELFFSLPDEYPSRWSQSCSNIRWDGGIWTRDPLTSSHVPSVAGCCSVWLDQPLTRLMMRNCGRQW